MWFSFALLDKMLKNDCEAREKGSKRILGPALFLFGAPANPARGY